MNDGVAMLERTLKMNAQFENFLININILFYSLLRAIFNIEFKYKIKIKY